MMEVCAVERNRLSFMCSTILAGTLLFLCVAPSLLEPYPAFKTDWLLLLFLYFYTALLMW